MTWEAVSRNTNNKNLEDCLMNVCLPEPSFKFLGNSEHVLKYKLTNQDRAHEAIMLCRHRYMLPANRSESKHCASHSMNMQLLFGSLPL